MRSSLIAVAGLVLFASFVQPTEAQFSSDIPGVPRAATPFAGGKQKRAEYDLSFYRFGGGVLDDTVMFAARFGIGQSWRVRPDWEVGFDISMLDGAHARSPKDTSEETGDPVHYTRGIVLHALKVGLKYRPVSSLTPDGNGYQVSLGVGYQASVKPLFAVAHGDTTLLGGVFADADPPIVGPVPQSLQVALMGSYRHRRGAADGALLLEKSEAPPTAGGPSPLGVYDGVSLRLGATYRVTPSLAVGGAFWGSGAPPWRDKVILRGPTKDQNVGMLVTFGSRPEAGTDLMLTSPTGKFGDSVRLYVRTRSTK